jgi:hypothetical protein
LSSEAGKLNGVVVVRSKGTVVGAEVALSGPVGAAAGAGAGLCAGTAAGAGAELCGRVGVRAGAAT